MTLKIQELLDALSNPGSIEDLGLIIDRIRDVYAVEHAIYYAVSLGQTYAISSTPAAGELNHGGGWWRRHSGQIGAGSYSPEWSQRYAELDLGRIDPVIEAARRSFVPCDWRALDWAGAKRQQFKKEAVDFGIGNQGYTIPIRGPDGQFAIFVLNSFCSDAEWDQFISEFASDMLVVAHFFHQKVIEIERIFGPPPPTKLSTREEDVLRYIACGKSRAQVAHALGISENTLRVYLDSARHKLGALNITHAASIAVSRGIVNL